MLALITLLILSTACEVPATGPTATPTRTPIIPTNTPTFTPSATPTSTPTQTPSPTPTLPAGLILPATPSSSENYVALPADLYFMRDGALWLWGAEGGEPHKIALETKSTSEKVLSYRITPNRNYIAYVTDAGKLYTFDSASWQSAFIPTSGDILLDNEAWFELSNDGSTITYMAWRTHPATEQPPVDNDAPYGTVLAVDRLNPRQRQKQLGFCTTVDGAPCAGFILSRDQNMIVLADGRGLWQTNITTAETTFITKTTSLLVPIEWTSDNQKVVFEKYTSADRETLSGFVILNLSPAIGVFEHTLECGDATCLVNASANSDILWISSNGINQGCLSSWDISTPGDTMPSNIICKLAGLLLHPTDVLASVDGRVRFLHHGCGEYCEGPGPGVYLLTPPDTFAPIALLPQSGGHLIWSSNGNAFIYLDKSSNPTYLGTIPGAHHLDVSRLLNGAYAFTWMQPIAGQP